MNQDVKNALKTDTLCDITTTGRKSGDPHKIEIAFHYIDGSVYISGLPGRRDWYANVVANPAFTFHLKQSMKADFPVRATPILDEAERRALLLQIVVKWNRENEIEKFVKDSPLIEVQLESS